MDFTYCLLQGLQFCVKMFIIILNWLERLFICSFEQETVIIKLHKYQLQHNQKQLETLLIEVYVFVSLKLELMFRRKSLLLGLQILKIQGYRKSWTGFETVIT
jgi:hypothetical protein